MAILNHLSCTFSGYICSYIWDCSEKFRKVWSIILKVIGQFRLTRQVTRSIIVVFNTTATSADSSFFFFFFKIWYLGENERENIALPKYQLLREFIKLSFPLSIKSLCYSSPWESVVKSKTRCTWFEYTPERSWPSSTQDCSEHSI